MGVRLALKFAFVSTSFGMTGFIVTRDAHDGEDGKVAVVDGNFLPLPLLYLWPPFAVPTVEHDVVYEGPRYRVGHGDITRVGDVHVAPQGGGREVLL